MYTLYINRRGGEGEIRVVWVGSVLLQWYRHNNNNIIPVMKMLARGVGWWRRLLIKYIMYTVS